MTSVNGEDGHGGITERPDSADQHEGAGRMS